jgi:hypothetical protein
MHICLLLLGFLAHATTTCAPGLAGKLSCAHSSYTLSTTLNCQLRHHNFTHNTYKGKQKKARPRDCDTAMPSSPLLSMAAGV